MSNLSIYQEEKSALSEVAFVKDIPSQVKIRDISSYERIKQFGIILPTLMVYQGIKGKLEDFIKKDIAEMIVMRFKGLSLNELTYAFKLERYGSLGDKTPHYQLFDADYVSKVLDKYVKWKQTTKLTHNISVNVISEVKATPEEITFWNNKGVTTCLEHFLATKTIKDGYLYVYEILYAKNLLPVDKEAKLKVKESAIELLKMEYTNKEAISVDEKREFKRTLEELELKKESKNYKNALVINKCKELSIIKFFRSLVREDKVEEFRKQFENKK